MKTQKSTFTLQRMFSLALILAMMAGMLPMPEMALASDGRGDQMTPGLRDAIQEALGPEALAPAIEAAKLTASDAAASDKFGWSVAINGDTALVGAQYNDSGGSNSGSAYIFQRDQGGADNWGQVKKLTASDAAGGDRFGSAVALDGDTALVGAEMDADNGDDYGSVYIFERNQGGTDNWGEVKEIHASDGAAHDQFGASVALSGETARSEEHRVEPETGHY